MAVLITGAAGFIGAHIAKRLADEGISVALVDTFTDQVYPSSYKRARIDALIPHLPVVRLDILQPNAVETFVRTFRPSTVIHLAAHASVTDSMVHPQEYLTTNILGTLAVLEAAKEIDARIVFASSSTVYADTNTAAQESGTPPGPISPYGVSKLAAEEVLRAWHGMYGIPVTVLRLFSVFGPWGRPDMAPYLFSDAIIRNAPLSVTTGSGRDYIYIDDVVEAFVRAINIPTSWGIYNIGSGSATLLSDLVQAIATQSGKKLRFQVSSSRQGEMRTTAANTALARRHLQWQPKWSLKDGVAKMVDWHREMISQQQTTYS